MGRGGESNEPPPADASFLDSDPRFADFLEDDFNAGDFASKALAKAEVTAKAQAEQLQVPSPLPSHPRTSLRCQLITFPADPGHGRNIHRCACVYQEGVRILEGRLRSEVAARHDALLHQAGRLREAEPALQGVTSTVGSLQGALGRVRAEIMEPYDQVQTRHST